ncbi:RodZ domain-containing protein [Actinomadura formosensis]|uniref:RodZ domain-containing protein n=1 Tax=Actinomadura formosensis TaxID=60706 RepID=UPI001F5EA027|nr:RodZ domain-containing protein [Actinomadura formosensis]
MAALALLVVGGMALVNAISGEPEKKGPATLASPSGGGRASPSESSAKTSPSVAVPLVIRVTGQPTTVVVRVADAGGKVLTNGTLNTGETLQYKESPLQVAAGNGGSLKVVIYGEVQPQKPAGLRAQWFVKAKS